MNANVVDLFANRPVGSDSKFGEPLRRTPLKGDGDGGDGMEARIARLESDVEHIKTDVAQLKKDVGQLKVDVATIKERLEHVVTHKWLAIYFAGLAALILRKEIISLLGVTS